MKANCHGKEVKENGFSVAPMTIADKKLTILYTDENGERTESYDYTLKSNQLLVTDDGIEAVFDKLEDGNLVMSMFIPSEGDAKICVSFFLVHPEK